MQVGIWDVAQPGFIEADTVVHCGGRLAGDFVWSLTMTDICTGWTECRAAWNKGEDGVMTQIKAVQKALPFPVKGFNCENSSQFPIPDLAFTALFPEPLTTHQVHALAPLPLERHRACGTKGLVVCASAVQLRA